MSEVPSAGINGCGSRLAYPFILTYIIIVPMITMNLFIAVVLQGYDMSLRENEAELKPSDLNEFVEKWSEYDPSGSGFISP